MREWRQAPLIAVQMQGGKPIVSGAHRYFAGHRLANDDGIFAGWNWVGATLTIENDRYGMRPMYYAVNGDRLRVSPSLSGFYRGATIDEDALAAFLRLGFLLGNRTPLANVCAVPPGARMTWHAGKLDTISHRPSAPAVYTGNASSAIEIYAELFKQAIARRRFDGAAAVPISGGRDSRHILLELCEQNRRPDVAVTVRHFLRSDEDARVAGELCKRLGVRHVVLDHVRDYARAVAETYMQTDMLGDEHVWGTPLGEFLEQQHASGQCGAIWDGIGGDVLSAGLFLSPRLVERCERREYTDAARSILRYWGNSEEWVKALLKPHWYRRLSFERALEAVEQELRAVEGYASPASMFYFLNRTRREIAQFSIGMMPSALNVYIPYIDRDVFEFLVSLPPSITLDKTFHQRTIEAAYPAHAAIPYESKEAPIVAESRKRRWLAIVLLKRSLRASPYINAKPLIRSALAGLVSGAEKSLWIHPARALLSRAFGGIAMTLRKINRTNDAGTNRYAPFCSLRCGHAFGEAGNLWTTNTRAETGASASNRRGLNKGSLTRVAHRLNPRADQTRRWALTPRRRPVSVGYD